MKNKHLEFIEPCENELEHAAHIWSVTQIDTGERLVFKCLGRIAAVLPIRPCEKFINIIHGQHIHANLDSRGRWQYYVCNGVVVDETN